MPDLRVARPDTIRTRLEAIREMERDWDADPRTLVHFAVQHAVAALELLEKADHRYRCKPGCWDCDIRREPYRSNDVRVAIVPDPERDAK